MGSVTIRRRKAVWRDRIRAYEVWIDGANVASLRSGESVTLPLEPGEHHCGMKIDWCTSRVIELDGAVDTVLECQAAGGSLFAIWSVTGGSQNYIDLQVVES